MYDMSGKFNTFYDSHVVLSRSEQSELYNKKNLNIQRLNDGLEEYNEEHETSYKIVETCVQGSVAMSTVIQNDEKDYDIDVAVVFDKDELVGKGARAIRNMVADALKRKTKQFNAEPEVKTSCVRVKYADGYHIDFAIYRREWNKTDECWEYEHAGTDWTKRDLKGLTKWFEDENDATDKKLRKVVRLSKMFCKSRDSWVNMPSGLLQTVLCDEKIQDYYDRSDVLFYYTMQQIVNRLESSIEVAAPVDNGRALVTRESDRTKMINWKNRLKSKLEDLDILFQESCTEDDALQAWHGFFNHDYWKDQISVSDSMAITQERGKILKFADTEQFIEDMFPMALQYRCSVECKISGDGWRPQLIEKFLNYFRRFLPHNLEIRCDMVYTSAPEPYKVFWKVKNVGPEAERRNMVRGQIKEGGKSIVEHSNFYGNHYIECYIIKGGYCVARTRTEVPIGRK